MFNQNTHRPQPASAPQGASRLGNNSFIRPSFLPLASTPTPSQPSSFAQMNPKSQRAALYDQARQQASQQLRATDPRTKLSSMLPGGLTERQRMDFDALQRTNPAAAQRQLDAYQRNADIRYNRPTPGAQPPASPGVTRPTNFNGPRRSFGR